MLRPIVLADDALPNDWLGPVAGVHHRESPPVSGSNPGEGVGYGTIFELLSDRLLQGNASRNAFTSWVIDGAAA